MIRSALLGALLALTMPTVGVAQAWFDHPFGEKRAYHRDWLAVCEESGAGPCRVVHMVQEPGGDGFFGVARLSVQRQDTAGYVIELYDAGLPDVPNAALTLVFDGQRVDLAAGRYVSGGPEGQNILQTLSITDPKLSDDLVRRMRAASRVELIYGEGAPLRRFSMLGISAALDAVDRQLTTRRE